MYVIVRETQYRYIGAFILAEESNLWLGVLQDVKRGTTRRISERNSGKIFKTPTGMSKERGDIQMFNQTFPRTILRIGRV